MPKYNYHEIKRKLESNPKYELPFDINAPVIAHFNKIGCRIACDKISDMQKRAACGKIEVFHDDSLNVKQRINISFGMADGYETDIRYKDGKWNLVEYSTVKNSNLTKKNTLTKEEK
jgi:hypothetical protein